MYLCGVELYHLLSRIFRPEFTKYNSNYTKADKPDGIIGVIRVNEGRNIWAHSNFPSYFEAVVVKKQQEILGARCYGVGEPKHI